MPKLRVLAVLPGITPDAGAEQSMATLLPRLVERGVQMHLALLTDRQALVPPLERAGVVIHDLSAESSTIGRARALRATVTATNPDVVHATLFDAAVPAQLAVLRTDAPVLVTWANTSYGAANFVELGAPSWKLRVVQTIEIVLARLASTRFHAVTSGVARVNRSTLLVPAERVLVGERGRDAARLEVDPAAVDRTRHELGLDDAPVVLAVGRQEPQKSYVTLLDAFDELAGRNDGVRLLIAGRDGADTGRLRQRLASMSHSDRVTFLGQRDDVATLLYVADVIACTSWREGAAGSLIEAMGCGLPIVTVPLDGLEDVVVDGTNGRVVERDRLAGALEELLADPELRARLGAAGREMFDDRFTIDRSTERMIEIYRSVAGS